MNSLTSRVPVRPRSKAAAAEQSALIRARAAGLFGGADSPVGLDSAVGLDGADGADRTGEPRAPGAAPASKRGEASPDVPFPLPPDAPAPGEGPVRRLRTWLYVRCGLELRTVVALTVVLAVGVGLAVQHYWAGRPRTVRMPPAAAGPALVAARPTTTTAKARLTVDIAGKVARPGLRSLPAGSRVADALSAAGGPLPGTDTTALNLARLLTDGEQLLVGVTPPPGALSSDSPPNAAPAPTAPLPLNSATTAQLDALPGVGPVLAQHLIDFRTQHGGFTSLDQLRQVPGIGDRKFATLKPLVQP